MVSFEHEVLLALFQTRPLLAAEQLQVLGVEVPVHAAARTDSADLTELAPTAYRADLVVVLEDGDSVLGVIVEVQLDWDSRKRYSWPVYAATLRARLECPVCVLVVVPTEALAKWCRTLRRGEFSPPNLLNEFCLPRPASPGPLMRKPTSIAIRGQALRVLGPRRRRRSVRGPRQQNARVWRAA